jgi:hypothetical protein
LSGALSGSNLIDNQTAVLSGTDFFSKDKNMNESEHQRMNVLHNDPRLFLSHDKDTHYLRPKIRPRTAIKIPHKKILLPFLFAPKGPLVFKAETLMPGAQQWLGSFFPSTTVAEIPSATFNFNPSSGATAVRAAFSQNHSKKRPAVN